MTRIASHNGIFTVKSTATGEHRTFRIQTWMEENEDGTRQPKRDDRGNLTRVVSLLTGSDNNSSYSGFGFVNGERIYVWRRCQGGQFDKFARMLEKLEQHEEAGRVEVNLEGQCRRCNRRLTTPESVESGIGPVCEGRE